MKVNNWGILFCWGLLYLVFSSITPVFGKAPAKAEIRLQPHRAALELKLAKRYYSNNQYLKSRKAMERLVIKYPKHLPTQEFFGELLMRYRDFNLGKPQWRKLIAMGTKINKAQYYWIKSMYELGEYDEAILHAVQIVKEKGPDQFIFQLLAEDALSRNDIVATLDWYTELTKYFPEEKGAWIKRSNLQVEQGAFKEAIDILREAAQHHPNDSEILVNLADTYRLNKDYDTAIALYRMLISKSPRMSRPYTGLISTLIEKKDFKGAFALLKKKPPYLKDYETDLLKGRIFNEIKKWDRAEAIERRLTQSPAIAQAIPILLYHGIGTHIRSANLPVTLFESQMKSLYDAGYTTITVQELVQMIDKKKPYPPKPIMITFDDARIDSFVNGDPILKKYNMKATMFVPTGEIANNHPFFADWPMMKFYAKTLRWDMQAHGHQSHSLIPVGKLPQKGNFLTNRKWIEPLLRFETNSEYNARLDGDYQEVKRLINQYVPEGDVLAYAFPFGEAGQGPDADILEDTLSANIRLFQKHYRFGLVQDTTGYNTLGATPPTFLNRFIVPQAMDGPALLKQLVSTHPYYLAKIQMAKTYSLSEQGDKARRIFQELCPEVPRTRDVTSHYLASLNDQQGPYRLKGESSTY